MNWQKEFCGVCVMSLIIAISPGALAVEIVLTFDDLSEGRTFRDAGGAWQPYAGMGVTIRGTGGSVPTVYNPSTSTDTEPHALINELSYGEEFGSYEEDLEILFAAILNLEPPSGGWTIVVQAWDLAGNSDSADRSFEYEHVESPHPPQPHPPNLDIMARGMEVTQSIQGWGMVGNTPQDVDNRVRLISGKKTLVRVYAEALGTEVDIPDIGCMLRAYAGADELPGSPIYSANRVTLVPGESYFQQRPDASKSFNFWLPLEWTSPGTIDLRATVNHFSR